MANKCPQGSIFDILKNGQAKKQCSRKKIMQTFLPLLAIIRKLKLIGPKIKQNRLSGEK